MDAYDDWFNEEHGTQQDDVEFNDGESSPNEENFNEKDIVDIVM